MGHFLKQVSIQKPGAQPRGHNIFKAAHISDLKNVSSTAFSTHFILVLVWGKAPFPKPVPR
jgi:hypothetical protein